MSGLRVRGLEEAMRPNRLFPICTHECYGFYAGQVREHQLLAAIDGRVLLVVWFGPDGDFIESARWELSAAEEASAFLQRKFAWAPTTVRVKQFRIPLDESQPSEPLQAALVGETGLAVTPLPLDWLSSLDDAQSLGAERAEYAAMVQAWIERGDFALYWGNEYHLDYTGQVVGS